MSAIRAPGARASDEETRRPGGSGTGGATDATGRALAAGLAEALAAGAGGFEGVAAGFSDGPHPSAEQRTNPVRIEIQFRIGDLAGDPNAGREYPKRAR